MLRFWFWRGLLAALMWLAALAAVTAVFHSIAVLIVFSIIWAGVVRWTLPPPVRGTAASYAWMAAAAVTVAAWLWYLHLSFWTLGLLLAVLAFQEVAWRWAAARDMLPPDAEAWEKWPRGFGPRQF